MAPKPFVDPMFAKALEQLSLEAQRYLTESGLSDPGVFESCLGDPSTQVDELAFEPGDVPKLNELLKQAQRAARGQRAEFARRGTDEFVRRDRLRREEPRLHETRGPTELQRAVEAPPPWHSTPSLPAGPKHKARRGQSGEGARECTGTRARKVRECLRIPAREQELV